MDLRNKKVTVVGLGRSGIDSALLLARAGAVVSVTDSGDNENMKERAASLAEKYIDLEIGKHTESFLEDTELLVVSPGVENESLPIRYANENSIPIISELELGYLFCQGTIVAVTGTNGKTTVATLLGEILRAAEIPVNVCGNIGKPERVAEAEELFSFGRLRGQYLQFAQFRTVNMRRNFYLVSHQFSLGFLDLDYSCSFNLSILVSICRIVFLLFLYFF